VALIAHGAGYAGPPPLTAGRFLSAWAPDPVVISALVLAAGLYLYGSISLRRRGHAWPVWREVSFVGLGLGTVAYSLLGCPAVYDDTLFWSHMVQHMALAMVAPIFLALGAPVTLALRTLPVRPRRVLTRVLHSRPARILGNPLFGFAVLFATPFAVYFTGIYEATLRHAVLHEWLHVHFLLAGCLFFWPLIGVDPIPGRIAHPLRLLLTFVSLPAHAFLGIAVMSSTSVLAAGYYQALDRPWGPSLLTDQQIGGGIMWAAGDIVGIIVLIAVFLQWAAADEREAVRTDRWLDRLDPATAVAGSTGLAAAPAARQAREAEEDAELAAYNARLAALARRTDG
jgi:putative copper resistance protein D